MGGHFQSTVNQTVLTIILASFIRILLFCALLVTALFLLTLIFIIFFMACNINVLYLAICTHTEPSPNFFRHRDSWSYLGYCFMHELMMHFALVKDFSLKLKTNVLKRHY